MDNTECILFSLKKNSQCEQQYAGRIICIMNSQLVLVVPNEMFIKVNKEKL